MKSEESVRFTFLVNLHQECEIRSAHETRVIVSGEHPSAVRLRAKERSANPWVGPSDLGTPNLGPSINGVARECTAVPCNLQEPIGRSLALTATLFVAIVAASKLLQEPRHRVRMNAQQPSGSAFMALRRPHGLFHRGAP